ncbi:glycosyltransferase [Enterovibrio baiacu]|uniref:glycosyltransferase n=1 Tax=Enterovibrio baiacu TaxID=2491023 RepID=UPI003D1406B1
MSKFEVNIVSDGNISTNVLLKQIFTRFKTVTNVNVLYIEEIKLQDLTNKINVFCRNCIPKYNWLPSFLDKNKIPYIYYIDDNLWELNDGSVLAKYHSSPETISSLDNFVKNATVVITSTDKLREYIAEYKSFVNGEVINLPNFVDFSKFPTKETLCNNRKGEFRIGYAGSPKDDAFQPVFLALEEIRDQGWEFSVEFVGFKPKTNFKIGKLYPFQNSYEEYIQLVHSRKWNLALAPFIDDYFWSFKTDNKYREYSALGIPAIYSNVEPYSSVVTDAENGFLVENEKESWASKILEVLRSEHNLAKISETSNRDVRDRYDINVVSRVWENTMELDKFYVPESAFSDMNVFYFKFKNNFTPSYFLFLGKLFLISVKSEGYIETFRKVIRFLSKGKK